MSSWRGCWSVSKRSDLVKMSFSDFSFRFYYRYYSLSPFHTLTLIAFEKHALLLAIQAASHTLGAVTDFYSCQHFIMHQLRVFVHSTLVVLTFADRCPLGPQPLILFLPPKLSDVNGHWVLGVMLWISLSPPAVLRGICTVGLLVTEAGLLLYTPPQPVAKRREPRPRHRRASNPWHVDAARQRPAPNAHLAADRRKPASDGLHRLLHLPAAPAPGVRPQLHAAGIHCDSCRKYKNKTLVHSPI